MEHIIHNASVVVLAWAWSPGMLQPNGAIGGIQDFADIAKPTMRHPWNQMHIFKNGVH